MATKNKHLVLKAGLGVAAVVAAAGAYYFFGKDGAKHQKSAQAWVARAKKDVLAELKKAKGMSEKTYNTTVAKVMTKYQKFQKENPEAYALLVKELKSHWPKIAKHISASTSKSVVSRAKSR